MGEFQIREEPFGVALYEAENAREALLDFLADRRRGELRELVRVDDDGEASIDLDGHVYRTRTTRQPV